MAKICQVVKVWIGLLVLVIVAGLAFSQAEGSVIEQVAELTAGAKNYQANGQYAEAEQVYRGIIQQYPGSDHALEAQKSLVLVFISSGNTSVQQEVAALTGYAENAKLAKVVYDIANHYWGLGKAVEAQQVYQYMAGQLPSSSFDLSSQGWAIGADIRSGNDTSAAAGTEKLKTDFAGHPELGELLHRLGNEYWGRRKYEKSRQFYQYIVEQLPADKFACTAQRLAITADLKLGNHAAVEAGIENLTTDFTSHPELAYTLDRLAREYSIIGKHEKARQMYQYIAGQLPKGNLDFNGRGFVIAADIKLGNYTAADVGAETLIADFAGHPELGGMLYRLGNEYCSLKKYAESRQLHQYIAEQLPKDKFALRGRRWAITADLKLGNDAAAEAGIEKLKTDFANHPKLGYMLDRLGREYRILGKYEKARQLYQYLADHLPANEFAFSGRGGVIGADIKSGNYTVAEARIKALIADFSEHPKLYGMLYQLGDDYRAMEEYESALRLYQNVVDNCSDRKVVLQGHVGIGLTRICLNDEPQVDAVVNRLIAEFNDEPRVDWGVFIIGEEYYDLAQEMKKQGLTEISDEHYRKAIGIWRRIIDDLPESKHATYAWYYSGAVYKKLKEYDKAVAHFEKVIEKWPDYEKAWYAQFHVGECYGYLIESGKLSKTAGNAAREAAYQKVIQNYPECKAVTAASTKLSQLR